MKILFIIALCLLSASLAAPVNDGQPSPQIVDSSSAKSSLLDQLIDLLGRIVTLVINSDVVQNTIKTTAVAQQPPAQVTAAASTDTTSSVQPTDAPTTLVASTDSSSTSTIIPLQADTASMQNYTVLESVPQVQGQESDLKAVETVYLLQDNGTEAIFRNQNDYQSTGMPVSDGSATTTTITTESPSTASTSTTSSTTSISTATVQAQVTDIDTNESVVQVNQVATVGNAPQNQSVETTTTQVASTLQAQDQPLSQSTPATGSNIVQTTTQLPNARKLLDAILAREQDLLTAAESYATIVQQLVNAINQSAQARNDWITYLKGRQALRGMQRNVSNPAVNQTADVQNLIQAVVDQLPNQALPNSNQTLPVVAINTAADNTTVVDLIQAIIGQQQGQVSSGTTITVNGTNTATTTATAESTTTTTATTTTTQSFTEQSTGTTPSNPSSIASDTSASTTATPDWQQPLLPVSSTLSLDNTTATMTLQNQPDQSQQSQQQSSTSQLMVSSADQSSSTDAASTVASSTVAVDQQPSVSPVVVVTDIFANPSSAVTDSSASMHGKTSPPAPTN